VAFALGAFAGASTGAAGATAGVATVTTTSFLATLVTLVAGFELIIPGVEEVWEDILRVILQIYDGQVSNFFPGASYFYIYDRVKLFFFEKILGLTLIIVHYENCYEIYIKCD
jgi:hypothetical protein